MLARGVKRCSAPAPAHAAAPSCRRPPRRRPVDGHAHPATLWNSHGSSRRSYGLTAHPSCFGASRRAGSGPRPGCRRATSTPKAPPFPAGGRRSFSSSIPGTTVPLMASAVGPAAAAAAAAAAATATVTAATAPALLAPFVDELDRIAPCVRIHGSQVRILETPAEFYETLKTMIRTAERRIFLSTLYIGKSEHELIATLRDALRAKPALKLYILTDALRGTREAPRPSSASLLAPLVADFGPDRVELRMYHTPNLTGVRKKYIPRRINEGWGLQHMKLYGADDRILLSGANLSTDYFTNRQDRYHLFSSAALTDAYWRLHRGVASLSFLVQPRADAGNGSGADDNDNHPGFDMVWPASNPAPSPLHDPQAFVAGATGVLRGLLAPPTQRSANDDARTDHPAAAAPPDTAVYVLAQMTQLLQQPNSSTEWPAVTHVLRTLARPAYADASWTFTAGYFNPAPALTQMLLATACARGNVVVTAAPEANGFFGSKGVSGMLPDAYTLLARRFLRAVDAQGRGGCITLKEWRRNDNDDNDNNDEKAGGAVATRPPGRGNWTYHAKGLWVTLPRETGPALTLVGSSNYTQRSYALDLEANALVVTRNAALQARLADETRWLQAAHARAVTQADFARPERRVRLHVRLAMWIVQLVGGAL
ncbi:cdp-diacylglycerol-glycerol-3-phosphate 3-phosphatidyltransferase [Niveomyces insectorum RCEF 264]|uniref:CDP-diacylglycerol--glycerol-3-phosphate 3-phosphatidyltransferase n=1 Tax=Niveomyces insectorum RCEF 264 TaxID=1081102 RepID=A0A167RVW9_9HYPO|nr:cdp-diacylglycerol-glycerol-3-phosphate 3-phosphatidyltransferase [Niveomyces insectorum RCEF 264]